MANVTTYNFAGNNGDDLAAGWNAPDFMIGDPTGSPDITVDGSDCGMLKNGKDDDATWWFGTFETDATANQQISIEMKANASVSSVPRGSAVIGRKTAANTYYALRVYGDAVQLWKSVAGSLTQLSTVTYASTIYAVSHKAILSMVGTTISGIVQRLNDNLYAQSDGSWNVSANPCISVVDSSISGSGGSAYAGFAMRCANRFQTVIDNVSIDSITAPPPPTAPSSCTAVAVSSTALDIIWTDNASDEIGFTVQIDTANTFDSPDLQEIDVPTANVTQTSAAGLEPGTLYYVRVLAYNGDGNSSYSNTASATTNTAPILTLASPTASVTVGQTVAALDGITVSEPDGDLLSPVSVSINAADVLAPSSIPAGWSTAHISNQYLITRTGAASAATVQAELRAMTFSGVIAGTAIITVTVYDADVASDSKDVTVTTLAAAGNPFRNRGFSGLRNRRSLGVTGALA